MSRRTIFITFPIILILGIYFLGPEPDAPKYDPQIPTVPGLSEELDKYVASQEAKHKIKPDNEARIVWADSSKSRTEYSVVYLHGFSASQGEGDPIHKDFAKRFGCNLYLARLSDHGVDTTEQLLYTTPDRLWESSKEALAIGSAIGDKVILMSTSTGGTLALMMAAQYPDKIFALINMSPNIAINHPLAFISNNPWGLQISRLVLGGDYNTPAPTPGADAAGEKQYWNDKYRVEAIGEVQELLESTMKKSTFEKVKQPSLTLYYYKNEQEQDPTVKVSAMKDMNAGLGTPDSLKVITAIPGAGGHVLASWVSSKDLEGVAREMDEFAVQKLGMKPVTPPAQIP